MAGTNSQSLLSIEGLYKNFDGKQVLDGTSLMVPRGSLVSVLGRSGAGKSVFLKCIAGIVEPDQGQVCFEGKPLGYGIDDVNRADFRRRCSFLFQGNALFDSMTALENVALPLEQTTTLKNSEIRERSLEALRQLDLEESRNKFPSQLSGGMQKRLALARALVTRPELVLFDEPTAGLDPLRCNAVFTMVAKYQRIAGFTALVVTHDIAEALVASDQVAMLEAGKICFTGSPDEFSTSALAEVRNFRDSTQSLAETIASIRCGEFAGALEGT